MNTPSVWMTYAEAAHTVGVTWAAVYDRVGSGKMTDHHHPSGKLLRRTDVMAWRRERQRRARALLAGGRGR